MFRYQIIVEYIGTNFRGWQIQKKGKTIQGLIQEKISKLLKEKIILFGSGRTDAGVHAIEQSAHFECKNKILKFEKFLISINHFLNKEGISITNIKKRNNNFTNTTVYKRKDSENHDNKFVDPDTLNSYLTISDLHENSRDNVNILRSNLQKLDERDATLEEMQLKSDNLMQGADKFKRRSNLLKNKMFWMHVFNWLLVAFFIFLIVFLITKLR